MAGFGNMCSSFQKKNIHENSDFYSFLYEMSYVGRRSKKIKNSL